MKTNNIPQPRRRSKPQTEDTARIAYHLDKAVEYLRAAIGELAEAEVYSRWGESADERYYIHQIAELISCDNGEAGLEAYAKLTRKQI